MTEQEIIEKIDSSLAEEFELDRGDMTPEANIYDDLGLDSLDTVDMVIVLEGHSPSKSAKKKRSAISVLWEIFIALCLKKLLGTADHRGCAGYES